jgi:hypothetical protein
MRSLQVRRTLTVLMLELGIFSPLFFSSMLSGIRTNAKPASPSNPHILKVGVWYIFPWFVFCLISVIRTNAELASPPDPHILNAGVAMQCNSALTLAAEPLVCARTHI